MLLQPVTVAVPAPAERDADLSEHGELSTSTRAAFGAAACEVGDPDHGASDVQTSAVDTVANVLHHVAVEADPAAARAVLTSALLHFEAEPEHETDAELAAKAERMSARVERLREPTVHVALDEQGDPWVFASPELAAAFAVALWGDATAPETVSAQPVRTSSPVDDVEPAPTPGISVAAQMALERRDFPWLANHIAGLRDHGLEREADEVERRGFPREPRR